MQLSSAQISCKPLYFYFAIRSLEFNFNSVRHQQAIKMFPISNVFFLFVFIAMLRVKKF